MYDDQETGSQLSRFMGILLSDSDQQHVPDNRNRTASPEAGSCKVSQLVSKADGPKEAGIETRRPSMGELTSYAAYA